MGVATLSLTPPSSTFLSNRALAQNSSNQRLNKSFQFSVSAKLGKEEPKSEKKPLFYSVTEALDFSQVRSVEDAQLLEDARQATRSGETMTREQYGALGRKIGGTYKNFFKSYVEDGEYVEEGWVDKSVQDLQKGYERRGEAGGRVWKICSCGLFGGFQIRQLLHQLLSR